jgi:hypothetical protein
MPQGYYSIEEWTGRANDGSAAWTVVLQLPRGATLTSAEEALQKLGKPGFYRVVQMQRVVWSEKENGGVKLRKSHALSPEGLEKMREMFERCGGRYPHEEVKADRRLAKAKRSRQELPAKNS